MRYPVRKRNTDSSVKKRYFTTYYKTILIKTVWYWNNDRPIDQ